MEGGAIATNACSRPHHCSELPSHFCHLSSRGCCYLPEVVGLRLRVPQHEVQVSAEPPRVGVADKGEARPVRVGDEHARL